MAAIHTPAVLVKSIAANGTVTINADYYILGIIFDPDATKTVTGLKIGTTSGGEQVTAAFTFNSGSTYTTKNPLEAHRCWNANQTLYIQAADWDTATITVTFLLQFLNT